ncbi:DUF4235 domain-containing protein [Litorihabitans aurantiacus]|uniref:Membrane protein n=1 Tax=Litorihabitans aurantiacus TaxID=1930061 RepID=A0AA37XHD6_9MICO|nr:DUF4235 domain-containing protein [Litorihabitans aurantiacus]GMA33243.1 membrane protein [Litorihabitans aurantiacus]
MTKQAVPETPASTSAKILYRPFGIASSVVGGLVASAIFKQVYKRVTKNSGADAPGPLQSEYLLRQVLVAAAIQGVIYAVVKASIDRAGARTFQKWTGEWPGS